MRLIDADALIGKTVIGGRRNNKTIIRYIVTNIVLNAPTVDAVPVIRCKDCKWWNADTCMEWFDTPYVPADGYCFRAERKEK